jgi:hypothetical protein
MLVAEVAGVVDVRVDERGGEPARPQFRLQRADPLLQLARGDLRRVEHHEASFHVEPPSSESVSVRRAR